MSHDQNDIETNENCQVCGAQNSARHNGVVCCRSCIKFFNCTFYNNKKDYICDFGIQKENHHLCKHCRYKKCLEVGMKPDYFCQACGFKMEIKFRYGAFVCFPCTYFFLRQTKKMTENKCHHSNRCIIENRNLRLCASCRYEACLRAGMQKSRVKQKNAKKDSKKVEIGKQICKVCEVTKELSYHYGAVVCHSCGLFFASEAKTRRRSECTCSTFTRFDPSFKPYKCPYCRYEACLRAGMLESRVGLHGKKNPENSNSTDSEKSRINRNIENLITAPSMIRAEIIPPLTENLDKSQNSKKTMNIRSIPFETNSTNDSKSDYFDIGLSLSDQNQTESEEDIFPMIRKDPLLSDVFNHERSTYFDSNRNVDDTFQNFDLFYNTFDTTTYISKVFNENVEESEILNMPADTNSYSLTASNEIFDTSVTASKALSIANND